MPRTVPLVFVSSTKADLSDYREHIIRDFPALDVLYRGMEFFGARPDRPKDVMLRELQECDLYVGLLAHRYGSTDASGMSFTEIEYRTAKAMSMPRLLFVIDPSHRVDPRSIERDPVAMAKLENLRNEVKAEHTVEFFSTPEDLVSKLGSSIRRWLESRGTLTARSPWSGLAARENDYIRELHSSDPETVKIAVRKLKRPDCHPALEHFYALLSLSTTRRDIVEDILAEIVLCADEERVAQVLLNLIEDRPALRSQLVMAIRDRALNRARTLTALEIGKLFSLVADSDPLVRSSVAHALFAVGDRFRDRLSECRAHLDALCLDSDPSVASRARTTLARLPV